MALETDKRILVVGDLMLDRYWSGDTSRISPEAPVAVVHIRANEDRPGGAANVALNIAALAEGPILLGLTGGDAEAGMLKSQLLESSVVCEFIEIEGVPTITKLRVLSRNQQLIRLDFEDGFFFYQEDALVNLFERHLHAASIIVLSDYGKGTLNRVSELIDLARKAGKKILVDPKGRDFTRYAGASVVTPNFPEFEAVVGPCEDEGEVVMRGRRLRSELGLEALLITRGEHGMTLIEGEQVTNLPTHAKEVYDVTGAGDTVIAALAVALAKGEPLRKAAKIANVAAGIAVGKLGTATVSALELEAAQTHSETIIRGVTTEDGLLLATRIARASGETIVMTNGCFDILHAGQVSYLQKARLLGDRLIVAVNDDDSVRRLKGEGRPINGLRQRMEVLAALHCVDWVVPFSEDTPERIISRVLPDILVKGGDYRADEVAGGRQVVANGGRVEIIDFVQGHSTTQTIQSIKSRS